MIDVSGRKREDGETEQEGGEEESTRGAEHALQTCRAEGLQRLDSSVNVNITININKDVNIKHLSIFSKYSTAL